MVLAVLSLIAFFVLAYSPYYTHPDLTEEIAKLFNSKTANSDLKISVNETQWMRKGAIDEDEAPRWINHFYDPVYKEGWKGRHFGYLTQEQGLYKGESMAPKPTIASIDWVTNQEYQSVYGRQYGNQTWQKAIKSYIDGDKKSAFIALGHILHLIEDVSVPDHTRNDTHADLYGDPGSPYEEYSKKYTNFNKLNIAENLKNKPLPNFLTIQSAFEYLATYSNNNFFSEDTINNEEYIKPNLKTLQKENGYLLDAEKKIYLAKYIQSGMKIEYTLNDEFFVLPSYFSNLAPQAVLAGASVLNLFFQEVEKYKQNSELLPEIIPDSNEAVLSYLKKSPRLALVNTINIIDKTTTNSRILFAQTSSVINDFFSGIFNSNQGFQSVGEIDLNQTNGTQPQTANQSSQSLISQTPIKQCSFAVSQSPSRSQIIINEVAWMGGANSADDEWIELKNISSNEINLDGYQLIDRAEQIKIVFNNSDKIPANGFYLLERTDDAAALGVKADKIYSGALANTNEGLRLFNPNCGLIDEVLATSAWPAGNNQTKKTMERSSDFNWQTSAIIGGTPKQVNSNQQQTINNQQQIIQEEEDNEVAQQQILSGTSTIQQATSSLQQTQQIQQIASFKQCVFNTAQSSSRQKVIINEVSWMGGSGDFGLTAADEWFELKNISNNEINLNGWQVIDKSENIKIIFNSGTKISTNGFYLLERTDDGSAPNISADKIYNGTLNNSDEGIRLFDEQCNLIDEVFAAPNWPAGDNGQKRTMERSPDFSWHTYNGIAQNGILGTPKRENSAPTAAASGGGTPTNNQPPITNNPPAKILISEIQIYPTGNRFIELYNPNNSAVDLTDWYLQRKTQTGANFGSSVSKTYFVNKVISAYGYFLISRNSLSGGDIILDDLTLTESNAIQLKNSNGEAVDKVGWGQASDCEGSCAAEPLSSQSIQRKFQNDEFIDTDNNAQDFEIQNCPSPKTQTAACQTNQTNQAPSAFFVNNLAISEIQVKGENQNDEFIEIYNPTDNAISLADYSIQYLSGTATSTDKISKKNFSNDSEIAAKSFYLVINSNATSSLKDKADMTYSAFSLSGISSGGAIFLVSATTVISDINDSAIIDSLSYGDFLLTVGIATSTVPDAGQSLERKAFSDGDCVSAQNENEFLGNSCDTDGATDFEIRGVSNPQNSQNFPEPRNAPVIPQNFNIDYSTSTMQLIFNWQESQDFSGGTSTLIYRIKEPNNASSTYRIRTYNLNGGYSEFNVSIIETALTSTAVFIDEVGRNYNFSVQAFDKEGLASETAISSISIPSFLSNLYFYKNPNYSDADYLIESFYGQYPFVPDVYQNGQNTSWKILVFYLNNKAEKREYIYSSITSSFPTWPSAWPQEILDKVLKVQFNICSGGNSSNREMLILPDIKEQCGVWGGMMNSAMQYGDLEDNHFIIKANDVGFNANDNNINFVSGDYLTVAYYSFVNSSRWSGGTDNFRLVAVDKTKYYFGNEPIHRPPTVPLNLTTIFNGTSSNLIISWDNSTDPDTIDGSIKYELNYHLIDEELDENNWGEAVKAGYQIRNDAGNISPIIQTAPAIPVLFDNSYKIYIRAKDEFGNYSEVISTEWFYPVFLE
ncbi:MAG: lamin tail domain-containing protein [Patescibacteria group bacterium]